MKKFLSINLLFKEANQAVGRFPLSMLLATVATVIGFFLIELSNQSGTPDKTLMLTLSNCLMALAFGIPLVTSVALAGERGKWEKGIRGIMSGGALLLMLAYYLWIIPRAESWIWYGSQIVTIVILNVSAYLTLTFAAFWNVSENQGFWQYNRYLVTRLFLTGLVVGVLMIGSNLILFTLSELFNLIKTEKPYLDMMTIILGMVAPLLFLGGIPKDLNELEKEKTIPGVVKNFGQYVLIPLLSIYTVILYVYAGKIALTTEWPKGIIAGLVIGYAAIGILSMLILYPFQKEKGSQWIGSYTKWFYRLLMPLVILLFLAVGIRISSYGITEIRYYGILIGVWVVAISLYNTMSKKVAIKWIPLSLSAVMLLSLWGPWSSFQISQNSQTNRLIEILINHEILQDNQLIKKVSEVSDLTNDEKENLFSIVEYLGSRHDFESIKPWFEKEIPDYESMPQWTRIDEVLAFMGINAFRENTGFLYYDVQNQRKQTVDISSYDEFAEIWSNEYSSTKAQLFTWDSQQGQLKITGLANKISIERDNMPPLEMDIESALKNLTQREKANGGAPSSKMMITAENEAMRATVVFSEIAFEQKGETYRINFHTGNVFIQNKN